MSRRLVPLFAAVLLAGPAAAQKSPDQALAALTPAAGSQVELFAAEPMLVNPTAIDVDHKGRVWVAEAVNYRRVNFGRPILRPDGDRIVVLADTDADGKADTSTVFYQGKDLYGPLGVCVLPAADGKGLRVLVCQSPDILEFADADGDLKADGPPKKFLTGFGGFDHDHGVHGVTTGPDGKLYFTAGDEGVGRGKGPDGKPVPPLKSADGKGREWVSNATDCRAGTVWRCDPDGNNLELVAHNFRNNYEACVDSFGEIWCSDNDDDGNQQTRICFVMPGGDYGYHPRGPGQSHWHEEQPGVVHKVLRTGFGSPTGICFYEGSLLAKYAGHLLHCDAGPREVRAFRRVPKGAGYELEKEVLLTGSDNWFRPTDVCVAPDGSVFVADWYDPGVGGHGMGDHTRGRIYRLTPKGHTGYKVPEVKLSGTEGTLESLMSPCRATRGWAVAAIASGYDKDVDRLLDRAMDAGNPPLQQARVGYARAATWKSGQPNGDSRIWSWANAKYAYPEDESLQLGTLAAQFMQISNKMWPHKQTVWGRSAFEQLPSKPAAVRRQMLSHVADMRPELAIRFFYPLAKSYDGRDHFYRAALNIALGTDQARRDAVLADFDRHFPEWDDKVADLVWELRPKSVLPRLGKLLADPKLTGPQKARIVDILAASDDPSAGHSILKLVAAADAPAEVAARALGHLERHLAGKWKATAQAADLRTAVDALLASPTGRSAGLKLVAAAGLTAAAPDVARLAADAAASLDVRAEAVRTLGELKDSAAVAALVGLAEADGPLSGPAVAALARQVARGSADTALDALQRIVLSPSAAADRRAAALDALTATRPGTRWLLDLQQKGELPPAVAADAGRRLRASPFQGERNKALVLFPAPGKLDPAKLPPIAELAARAGDPEAGRKVWAASARSEALCAKCHMARGTGGRIGPDLSAVGVKGSKENLFESILYPSKAVADQFATWVVNTTDGQTVSGLVVGETETALTVRDANGQDHAIPLADVDSRKRSPNSLMPDGLAAALTADELVDLVAYLTTLRESALTPDAWHVAGPFAAPGMLEALGMDFGPDGGGVDPATGKPGNVAWRAIRPSADGYIDLAAGHGDKANNSASYLYQAIESPADQAATLLLGSDDGALVWVNGKQVLRAYTSRAAAPEQERVAVTLKKGINHLLVKVANGDGPHGAFVTLLSGQPLTCGK